MTKNIRTPSVQVYTDVDPFLELGLPVDENVRPINPTTESNGLSRADAKEIGGIFTPDMNRLDRLSAARAYQRQTAQVADRVTENYGKIHFSS